MLRRVLLAGAFVFCAAGVFGLLNRDASPEPVVAEAQPEQPSVKIWRASRALSRGELITREDVEADLIARDATQGGEGATLTLKPGVLVRESIVAGARITDALLVAPDAPDYLEYLIDPGMIPYPLTIPGGDHYALVLNPGDYVDVVMIASLEENLANTELVSDYRGFSIGPLLSAVRVLQVPDSKMTDTGEKDSTVILELSREQVSRLMMAKRIGQLDLHKSTGEALPIVRTGDVLPGYFSVRELRGASRQVN